MAHNSSAKDHIIQKAREAGFDLVRFTDPGGMKSCAEHLRRFVDKGRHGEMAWMAAKLDRRGDPRILWPEVQSIILVAMNYSPGNDPLTQLDLKDHGNISVYARGRDYHDVVKKKLKQVAGDLHRTYDAEVKVFVDTAPVMEKPLAMKAGLGWQGKHTNLISRDYGSWLFLGSIFTTLSLEPDPPETDHCGSCRKCLDICPTRAFPAPYQLDARRCISYLTIEYKGHIRQEFRKALGNRIYGCDDCLGICPWNKYATKAQEAAFLPRGELTLPALSDLVTLDEASFRRLFSGSPIKRIGRDFFIRNVLIAMGNSGNPDFIAKTEQKLCDPSPYVRAMAVWALGQLCDEKQWHMLEEKYYVNETNSDVCQEWNNIQRNIPSLHR